MSTLRVDKIAPFQSSSVEIDGTITLPTMATTGSNTFVGNQIVTGSIDITGEFLVNGIAVSGSGGGSVDTSSLATTGSNAFNGDQTITGSLRVTGSNITNTDDISGQYLGSNFGGNVGVFNVSDFTEVGFALDGAEWTTNWSNGPILYVNNTPGDTYEGVFGFEDKTNYTDGKVTALKPLVASNSLTITGSVVGNVVAVSVSSNTASINLNDGNFFSVTLGASGTTFFNITNVKAGQTSNILVNTDTASTASFSNNVWQQSGSMYVASPSGSRDIITLLSFDNEYAYLAEIRNFSGSFVAPPTTTTTTTAAPAGEYTLTGPQPSSTEACNSGTTNTFYTNGSAPNPSVFLYQDIDLILPANDGFYASLGASQWFEISGFSGEITATGPCS